jgi:hypothetical protein
MRKMLIAKERDVTHVTDVTNATYTITKTFQPMIAQLQNIQHTFQPVVA